MGPRVRGDDLRQALTSNGFAATASRYAFVGGSMAVLYAAVLSGIVNNTGLPAGIASLMASAVVTPMTYLGQKFFTFRSSGQVHKQFAAFMVVVVAVFAIGALSAFLIIDVIGVPAFLGGLMVACIAPICSFFMQRYWVFSPKAGATDVRT